MQGMLPTRWTEVKSDIASAEMVSTVSFEVISKLQRDRQHHSHAVTGMHYMYKCFMQVNFSLS